MLPLNDPGPSVINPFVQAFFADYITVKENTFLFSYQNDLHGIATEYWAAALHLVPISSGIWLVCNGSTAQVRHLFVAGSAADILCFCNFHSDWLNVTCSVAFAALGLLATAEQIGFLTKRFVNARIHTIFESGLTGRVTDCKIALWQKGKDASFMVIDDQVQITYRNRRYKIPVAVFSLNRFETTLAIRSKIRTHKPKGCLGSYHEFFVSI